MVDGGTGDESNGASRDPTPEANLLGSRDGVMLHANLHLQIEDLEYLARCRVRFESDNLRHWVENGGVGVDAMGLNVGRVLKVNDSDLGSLLVTPWALLPHTNVTVGLHSETVPCHERLVDAQSW
jgi:hypothetical protein